MTKPKEGGPGSGPQAHGGEISHRGARVYSSGGGYRALTPSGHNIGPFKSQDLIKSHLDKNPQDFGLKSKEALGPEPSFGFGPGAIAGVDPIVLGGSLKHAKGKKEAVASSSFPAQLKAQTKKEAGNIKKGNCTFRESNNESFKNHKFEVVIIKEGLGNFRDCFFYSKGALQKAAEGGLFEGSQCYADHPSSVDEEVRPERSTRDILGYYENVQYKENDQGQGLLVADLLVAENISLDWAMSLLTNSIEYSKKFKEADLVGLSINASGAASVVDIDKFMTSQQLAESVMAKLVEAKQQGISEINVVDELKEAQSVDLVTKAGAGGRILQMLEQEKSMKKKKHPFLRESEGMEKHEGEDGLPSKSDGATPDHADADQDKALFAQMIKQYLGKDDASEQEMEMAQAAHEACKEAGMEGKEAMEAAGKHLQMAMAVGKKMSQKQSKKEGEHEAESHEAEGEKEAMEAQTPPPNPKSSGAKKESMELMQLTGEVARLTEIVKRSEAREYLDAKLAESGKSNLVTKKFREALGTPKSKEQIDNTWKVFVKAYEAGVEEFGPQSDGLLGEKNTSIRESAAKTKTSSMKDCLR